MFSFILFHVALCYLSQDSDILVGHLVPLEHYAESLEAFHLLVSL